MTSNSWSTNMKKDEEITVALSEKEIIAAIISNKGPGKLVAARNYPITNGRSMLIRMVGNISVKAEGDCLVEVTYPAS